MMNKIALMTVLVVSSVASADVTLTTPADQKMPVLRKASNEYTLPGLGTVRTVACTVTAEGTVTARVVGGTKPWIYFYDRDGQREADCQLLNRPQPTITVKREKIHRGIATVE